MHPYSKIITQINYSKMSTIQDVSKVAENFFISKKVLGKKPTWTESQVKLWLSHEKTIKEFEKLIGMSSIDILKAIKIPGGTGEKYEKKIQDEIVKKQEKAKAKEEKALLPKIPKKRKPVSDIESQPKKKIIDTTDTKISIEQALELVRQGELLITKGRIMMESCMQTTLEPIPAGFNPDSPSYEITSESDDDIDMPSDARIAPGLDNAEYDLFDGGEDEPLWKAGDIVLYRHDDSCISFKARLGPKITQYEADITPLDFSNDDFKENQTVLVMRHLLERI